MVRLAANLTMLFPEMPFLDRFDAAARAGFRAVEFLSPYDHPAAEVRARADAAGVMVALFNTPPGDWAAGERGFAAVPGREREFRDGLARALDYAETLDCRLVHCMAGIPPAGTSAIRAGALFAENLAWAAEQATARGVRLVIEPINPRDMPGYHLASVEQAAALVGALGVARVSILFDAYHVQVAQGDLLRRLEAAMPLIGHVQIADPPGRHEPGTGEIGWPALFATLDRLGYAGWVGCEYRPAADTVAGLSWRERFGAVP